MDHRRRSDGRFVSEKGHRLTQWMYVLIFLGICFFLCAAYIMLKFIPISATICGALSALCFVAVWLLELVSKEVKDDEQY